MDRQRGGAAVGGGSGFLRVAQEPAEEEKRGEGGRNHETNMEMEERK